MLKTFMTNVEKQLRLFVSKCFTAVHAARNAVVIEKDWHQIVKWQAPIAPIISAQTYIACANICEARRPT